MRKKLFAILMSALMMVSFMPAMAFATPQENCPGGCNHEAKIGTTHYDTLADAVEAANAGDTVEIIIAGTYKIPNIPNNITIKGTAGGVTLDCSGSSNVSDIPKGANFEGLTLDFGAQFNNRGFYNCPSLTINSCSIKGEFWTYAESLVMKDCSFVDANKYSLYVYGSDFVELSNCTFTGNENGKAVKIAKDGDTNPVTVIAKSCKFTGNTVNKNAFMLDTRYSPITVIASDCTFEGAFASTAAVESTTTGDNKFYYCWDEYKINGGSNYTGSAAVGSNVEIDDNNKIVSGTFEEFYGDNLLSPKSIVTEENNKWMVKKQWEVIADQKLVNIYTADGLFAFADSCKSDKAKAYSGYEIHIKDDMDITGRSWTTIDAWETWDGLTIDGENHTITGLGVPSALTDRDNPHNYGVAFITNVHGSTVVKNITFDEATVTAQNGSQVAVIIGMSYGNVTFENVTVSNSKIDTTTKAGAFLGQNDEGLVTLNNCTLANTTVKAEYSFALMVGLLNENSNGVVFNKCLADEDSRVLLAAPEEGTQLATIDEFVFKIDSNKLWLHNPNGAWAEQRVIDQKCKYNGTEYTVLGSKFYYADKVVTLPEVYPVVAQIGDKQYGTLADAIAAVQNNETIQMIADVDNAAGISVETGKTFTIDFKGHTYTVNKPGAGSSGTQTAAFQLKKGQTITFKNGTIKAAEDNLTEAVSPAKNIKRFFQNYANLTLENMTIDGTNIYGENSVIEFANGTVNITGNTSITAKSGVKAINVDTWKGAYPDGAHVTINTTGAIGDIYLYAEETGTFTKSSLTIQNGRFSSVTGDDSKDYTVTLSGGVYSSQPNSEYVAKEYSVYKLANPVTYVVSATAPAHSAGMNTWTLNAQTGLYEESYVAPPKENPVPEKIEETTSIDVSKEVEVKKDESGVVEAKAEVSEKVAESIVEAAKANKSEEVVIAAVAETKSTETVTKAEVALPVKAIEELAKVETVQNVVIQTNVAEIALDKKTAEEIAKQAPEGATIIVEAVREDEKSKEVAQDVYELKIIAVQSGTKTEIGDFKGGKVTVKVDIPEGLTGKKVACLYRDDNGKYTRRAVTKQDDVNGFFSFTTNHFSDYIVTEESTAQKMLVNQTAEKQKKLKAYANGKIKVSFDKVTYDTELGKRVQTYQIYRSTKKNSGFKKVGTVTNKKKSTKTITFTNAKKLKKGKKYYYKVRGRVQLANGKYAYTQWSNVRYAKCKKSR
ncbi:MAG: hypothetical protein KBS56_04265 [Clostridiales bacterium]|nr:hypothetical protein [Candidatus Crickella equi]